VWLNIFRAPPQPSSGAYNCISSLWFYRWSVVVAALLVMVWPVIRWAGRVQVIALGWWTARRITASNLGFPDSNRRCCYAGLVQNVIPAFYPFSLYGYCMVIGSRAVRWVGVTPRNRLGDEWYLYTVSFWSLSWNVFGTGSLGKQSGRIVHGCVGIVRCVHAICMNGFDTLLLNTVVKCGEYSSVGAQIAGSTRLGSVNPKTFL
jgi:hypothetical protein